MRVLERSVLTTLALVLLGCTNNVVASDLKIEVSKQANPWTHLRFCNNPDNFHFAIVSDRTGGHLPGVFTNAVNCLNLLRPEFVMSVGDLVEGYVEDANGPRDCNEEQLSRQWDEFDGLVEKLRMPFFYIPGNHEIFTEETLKKWQQRRGRSYYHFRYCDVLFLCLNSEEKKSDHGPGYLSDSQIDYFRKVLVKHRNVRWTLLFLHKPMWKDDKNESLIKIEKLLAGRNYTFFAGHVHAYSKTVRNGQRYYTLATTGASGGGKRYVTSEGYTRRKLLGLDKGQFDHIVWVTMTDDGPVIANLLLEGILERVLKLPE